MEDFILCQGLVDIPPMLAQYAELDGAGCLMDVFRKPLMHKYADVHHEPQG